MWIKSEGIYHPPSNPSKSIPYTRWTHRVRLNLSDARGSDHFIQNWLRENEYYVSISKWRETYSIEIRLVNCGKEIYSFSFKRKISFEEFDFCKHELVGQAFSKAKSRALEEYEEDLETYYDDRDWDWGDDEAYQ